MQSIRSPFLTQISLRPERVTSHDHPFDILAFRDLAIELVSPITFLVGENGSGKSTLLEGIAQSIGFGAYGGNRDHTGAVGSGEQGLAKALRLGWQYKVAEGFFFRSETFFSFANRLELAGSDFGSYGGRSLLAQSQGEAFLALFQHRFKRGLYLVDEPEAALSPQRQLAFLRVLHSLVASGLAQLIIATHSPILLSYPGASILSLDGGVRTLAYEETTQYRITRDFLNAPDRFYHHLFQDGDGE